MKRQLTTADFDAFVAGEAIGIDPKEVVAQFIAGLTPPVERQDLTKVPWLVVAPDDFIPICEGCLTDAHLHDEEGRCIEMVEDTANAAVFYFCRCRAQD